MPCICQGCHRPYYVDLMVPDDLWERIKPEGKPPGGGLLCPSCIGWRIEDLHSAVSKHNCYHVSKEN